MVDINSLLDEATAEGYHFGHLFMSIMKKYPDEIYQIDASTGQTETNASVLERSVRLAKCLRRQGLKTGDVIAVSGRNIFDIHVPIFAGMINGLPVVGIDYTYKFDEICYVFELTKPKVAFCQNENVKDFERAAAALNLDTKIITFDKGDYTMAKFMDSFEEDGSLNGFEPTKFDPEKVYLWLISTGGTTGRSKIAAFTHKSWLVKSLGYGKLMEALQNGRTKRKWSENVGLNVSTLHWVSGIFNHIGMPLCGQTKVQTPDQNIESIIDMINKYKPRYVLLGSIPIQSILNHKTDCDLTCLDVLILTGGPVYQDVLAKVKSRVKKEAIVMVAYGQTETMGPAMSPDPFGPPGTCGKASPLMKLKLVDPETGTVVTEPYKHGELWTCGLGFSEYYNSPEETAAAITEDGWYKTGDIMYRDENGYYFFVDRIKMLIKYRAQHVMPVELEDLIRSHPDVLEVGVTSIPHAEDGEHPVACVVRRPGCDVTADDIKEIVATKLSESKQLRGGVVFLDKLPMTSTDKLARAQLKKLVLNAKRE